jgi:CPA1 family monovalent cation:H+ antiporter
VDASLKHFVALLAVAMFVAIAARRVRLPYTVGLVVVGAGLTLGHFDFGEHLTRDLIFNLILPPLLFEAALSLSWRELKRDLAPILVFAILGSAVATLVVAWSMTTLLSWPLGSALVFGALIAATDPVAIIAMFKDNSIHGRLRLLVESESLMNDGAAAVLFVAALDWALAGAAEPLGAGAILRFAVIVFGGIGLGAAFGVAAILCAGRTSEHLVEAALTSLAAYGSFLTAEHFHVSGVLATVIAGLVMGNLGFLAEDGGGYLSAKGREFAVGLWEFVAFLANSIVFLLIGVDVAAAPLGGGAARMILLAIGVVLFSRAVTIYPLSLGFAPTRWRLRLAEQHVLWWGGLRGALALALALSLPPELPLRDEIRVATFGVVAFSIVVQGLTTPILLRALGLMR